MKQKKNLSLINCIATGLIAFFLTIPMHELFHFLTDYAYGDKVACFSAGAVEPAKIIDYKTLAPFHRIMVAGGSASILNLIIGIILLIILVKVKMGPTVRLLLTQLMGGHLAVATGYFFIGGVFGFGDWGLVYAEFPEGSGIVLGLRIALSILGAIGIVFSFFALNYMSYYFIEDSSNKKERFNVAAKLHLVMVVLGFGIAMLAMTKSPAIKSGELSYVLSLFYDLMWIVPFWAFMFTWVMVKPPKKNRFLYNLPAKPKYILWALGLILTIIDIFILGPGIWLN